MSAAQVFMKETDLTASVKSFDGVYNAILINAKKGDVGVPRLVTDESQLLKYFTPKEKIEVGYDLGYYSALAVLQRSNKLWVVRVANEAKYGGINVYQAGSYPAFKQLNETSPEKPKITFDVTNISVGSNTITVSNILTDYGVLLKAGEILGRTIVIPGATGTYQVLSVDSPDSGSSNVTLDREIESNDPTMTGTGTGTVNEIPGISFDISNVDTSDIANTKLTIYNLQNGAISDIAVNDPIYVFDNSVYKEFIVKNVDTDNSILTIDATGEESYISNVVSGRTSYPSETLNVLASEGSNDVTISGLKGNINWLVNREIALTLNLSDGTTFNFVSTIDSVDSETNKITLVDAINYPGNDFVTPVKSTSEYVAPEANGFEDPEAVTFDENAVFYITQKDPGEWGKDLRIEIITNPEIVKEPNAFILNVYLSDNINIPVESWVLSRKPGTLDGYGRNIYINDALQGSNYIRGFNNPLVDENILPAEISKSHLGFMVAGNDGLPVTESTYVNAVDVFANKNNYPVTLILDGGITLEGYQKKLLEICEIRKDCFAILSTPISAEFDNDYLNKIIEYRKVTLNANSSFGAIFTSHLKIVDKFNDRDIYVSPDGYAAAAINYSATNFEIWYPPAGQKRGVLFVKDVLIKFKDGELNALYDAGINPIRFYPGKGISIWGQKTLSSRPSALDRINIRMLLIVIENAIAKFLEDFLFELNDDMTGKLIEIQISNYLDSIKARKGIQDYLVVSDETNNTPQDYDNHIRNVDVYIKPTQSLEWINFTTILTPSGLSFKDAQLMK